MPLITSYVRPQLAEQALAWNPDCPALSKCVSAFFFSDGNRSYINPDFLSPNYTAAPGGASMQRQTNRLGFFVQKTVGGASPMFSGLASPSGCSTITLCQLQYQNIGIMSDSAVSNSWACNSSQKLIVYMASFTRGTSSTSIVGRPVVIGTDNTSNAHRGYIDGTLEIGPVSGYYDYSIDKLGSGHGGTGPDVGFQVFLGFSSVLTAAEHKQIADILLRDPMELFAPIQRRIWVPLAGVTVGLSGNALSFASGSLSTSLSLNLSGNAQSLSRGSLLQALSLGLIGNVQSFSGGTPQLGLALALSGQAQSLTVGTLTPAGTYTISLTGSALSFASGVLSPEIEVALVGQELSTTAGQLLSTITLGLTGNTEVLSAGSLSIAGTGTLDPATIQAIVDAVWSDPRALTLAKFLALKDG